MTHKIKPGSVGVGKSTQAELLSNESGQPRYCYNEVKADYLTQVWFDKNVAASNDVNQSEYATGYLGSVPRA
jgi:adenylate kinase family enzyme